MISLRPQPRISPWWALWNPHCGWAATALRPYTSHHLLHAGNQRVSFPTATSVIVIQTGKITPQPCRAWCSPACWTNFVVFAQMRALGQRQVGYQHLLSEGLRAPKVQVPHWFLPAPCSIETTLGPPGPQSRSWLSLGCMDGCWSNASQGTQYSATTRKQGWNATRKEVVPVPQPGHDPPMETSEEQEILAGWQRWAVREAPWLVPPLQPPQGHTGPTPGLLTPFVSGWQEVCCDIHGPAPPELRTGLGGELCSWLGSHAMRRASQRQAAPVRSLWPPLLPPQDQNKDFRASLQAGLLQRSTPCTVRGAGGPLPRRRQRLLHLLHAFSQRELCLCGAEALQRGGRRWWRSTSRPASPP